jgi:hypothetical protein
LTYLQPLTPWIRGRPLQWYSSYLTGGSQVVDWSGSRSGPAEVKFGVRQGSILGPLLFLIHVADLPSALGIEDEMGVNVEGRRGKSKDKGKSGTGTGSYADDSHVTAVADTVEEVITILTAKAVAFSRWAKGNGLALNGAKTQFILSSSAGDITGITINVDGATVTASTELDLLGTTVDRHFSFLPHTCATARAARQRASLIARLGNYLPPGWYLGQLAMGLAVGKVSHAIAAATTPRLVETVPATCQEKAI